MNLSPLQPNQTTNPIVAQFYAIPYYITSILTSLTPTNNKQFEIEQAINIYIQQFQSVPFDCNGFEILPPSTTTTPTISSIQNLDQPQLTLTALQPSSSYHSLALSHQSVSVPQHTQINNNNPTQQQLLPKSLIELSFQDNLTDLAIKIIDTIFTHYSTCGDIVVRLLYRYANTHPILLKAIHFADIMQYDDYISTIPPTTTTPSSSLLPTSNYDQSPQDPHLQSTTSQTSPTSVLSNNLPTLISKLYTISPQHLHNLEQLYTLLQNPSQINQVESFLTQHWQQTQIPLFNKFGFIPNTIELYSSPNVDINTNDNNNDNNNCNTSPPLLLPTSSTNNTPFPTSTPSSTPFQQQQQEQLFSQQPQLLSTTSLSIDTSTIATTALNHSESDQQSYQFNNSATTTPTSTPHNNNSNQSQFLIIQYLHPYSVFYHALSHNNPQGCQLLLQYTLQVYSKTSVTILYDFINAYRPCEEFISALQWSVRYARDDEFLFGHPIYNKSIWSYIFTYISQSILNTCSTPLCSGIYTIDPIPTSSNQQSTTSSMDDIPSQQQEPTPSQSFPSYPTQYKFNPINSISFYNHILLTYSIQNLDLLRNQSPLKLAEIVSDRIEFMLSTLFSQLQSQFNSNPALQHYIQLLYLDCTPYLTPYHSLQLACQYFHSIPQVLQHITCLPQNIRHQDVYVTFPSHEKNYRQFINVFANQFTMSISSPLGVVLNQSPSTISNQSNTNSTPTNDITMTMNNNDLTLTQMQLGLGITQSTSKLQLTGILSTFNPPILQSQPSLSHLSQQRLNVIFRHRLLSPSNQATMPFSVTVWLTFFQMAYHPLTLIQLACCLPSDHYDVIDNYGLFTILYQQLDLFLINPIPPTSKSIYKYSIATTPCFFTNLHKIPLRFVPFFARTIRNLAHILLYPSQQTLTYLQITPDIITASLDEQQFSFNSSISNPNVNPFHISTLSNTQYNTNLYTIELFRRRAFFLLILQQLGLISNPQHEAQLLAYTTQSVDYSTINDYLTQQLTSSPQQPLPIPTSLINDTTLPIAKQLWVTPNLSFIQTRDEMNQDLQQILLSGQKVINNLSFLLQPTSNNTTNKPSTTLFPSLSNHHQTINQSSSTADYSSLSFSRTGSHVSTTSSTNDRDRHRDRNYNDGFNQYDNKNNNPAALPQQHRVDRDRTRGGSQRFGNSTNQSFLHKY